MPPPRVIGAVTAVVVLIGLLAIGSHVAAVDEAEQHAAAVVSPSTPLGTAGTSGTRPFAARLLVYANDALSAAQVRAVRAATHTDVVTVSLAEEFIASGRTHYPDIPVLTMVADPRAYSATIGRPDLSPAFGRGAVLAASEARLRHATVGGVIRFTNGRRVPVTAVVDDHLLGGNEMSLPAAASRLRTLRADYLLVADGGDAASTERLVRHALGALRVRVETRTENGYLSSADRVLTQLQVKARYGEFSMRRTGRTTFVQDPGWINRHLVTTRVVQLGLVTCNRAVVPALRAAMQEVTRRGLGSTVHTADFEYEGGCWNPNIMPGVQETVSRHSWGIAFDVNVDVNTFGYRPHQDPRLVAVLSRHGFTWGGRWLMPDGMHFESIAVE